MLQQTLQDIDQCDSLSEEEFQTSLQRTAWIMKAESAQIISVFTALNKQASFQPQSRRGRIVSTILAQSLQRIRVIVKLDQGDLLPVDSLSVIDDLYRQFFFFPRAQFFALSMLTAIGTQDSMARFCDLLIDLPPSSDDGLEIAFAPLLEEPNAVLLYPRLLEALQYSSVAAAVLDLANHLKRSGMVEEHPARAMAARLQTLLAGLAARLSAFEADPRAANASPETIGKTIAESVALGVALCDSLSLMGVSDAIETLRETMQLKHRRLRTESAAALARLGDSEGRQGLLELTQEPIARLRALAYAEELGAIDEVDYQYRNEIARAESELAIWLSLPEQMGVPPTSIKLADTRQQFWPGFEDLVECFLFEFEYRIGETSYQNFGIVGPYVHAFTADLTQLEIEDIYAVFAGWGASHEEIKQYEIDELPTQQQPEVGRLTRKINDRGFLEIEPDRLGLFFGERVLIAKAKKEQNEGVVVSDYEDVFWFPNRDAVNPIDAEIAYSFYQGKKLLRSFNE